MVPTLVLDLDGTLVDSIPDLLASLNRLMDARDLAPFVAAEVRPMIGDGAGVLVRRAMAARDRVATPDDMRFLLADYTANVADGSVLFPGAEATLHAMKGDGWRLAVCTNKPVTPARDLLAALGVLDLFAAIGGGDSYPARKPDPAHLLGTLADAGGHAAAAVMVGDHRNDVLAAEGAAVPCIFAAWGYGEPGGPVDATAQAFTDIAQLAPALLERRTADQDGGGAT
ncbi:MAG: HAD hydrolase-like protein [Gemmatimonadaceae bacterium]|nr:HAD hydrolase-like protein [Acetobacteraceae bacterium]